MAQEPKKQEGEINLYSKVKVIGVKQTGKVNHLKEGVEYTVHPEAAKHLIEKGAAKYADKEPVVSTTVPKALEASSTIETPAK